MTNIEKFEEVFGFVPSRNVTRECVIPNKICEEIDDCAGCPFNEWWNREYKSCFRIKEEYK